MLASPPAELVATLRPSSLSSADHPPTCPMGSYLGRPWPSPPPQAVGGQHLPGGLGRPIPHPPIFRGRPRSPSCGPAVHHKPAHKYPVTLHLRFVTASLRRCSIIPHPAAPSWEPSPPSAGNAIRGRRCWALRISTGAAARASAVEHSHTVCGGCQQQVTPCRPPH